MNNRIITDITNFIFVSDEMFLLFLTLNYAIIVSRKGAKHYAYYYAY